MKSYLPSIGRGTPGLLSLSLAGLASSDVGGLQSMLSGLLGVPFDIAGWFLGVTLTFAFVMITIILEAKLESASAVPILFMMSTGMSLAVGFGWWPIWPIFVAVVIALLAVMGLLSSKG